MSGSKRTQLKPPSWKQMFVFQFSYWSFCKVIIIYMSTFSWCCFVAPLPRLYDLTTSFKCGSFEEKEIFRLLSKPDLFGLLQKSYFFFGLFILPKAMCDVCMNSEATLLLNPFAKKAICISTHLATMVTDTRWIFWNQSHIENELKYRKFFMWKNMRFSRTSLNSIWNIESLASVSTFFLGHHYSTMSCSLD